MSTPSTATITVPPNHQYYARHAQYLPPPPAMSDYHHNAAYQPAAVTRPTGQQYPNNYTTSQATAGAQREDATNTRQSHSQTSQYYDAKSTSQPMTGSRKRNRAPVDWEAFYGHNPPTEIIQIHDDTPVPEPKQKQKLPAPVPSATVASTASGEATRHTDKRRKMDASTAQQPRPYYPQTSLSNPQSPYYEDYARQYSGSTDRTASYNTTAPTSLGSSSSGTYLDDASVGQKRKRSTRQAAADQKRREIEYRSDPFSEYVPPPRPPIKAKDVHVQVITDRTASRDQKVDDDDGHYIVTEDADLTERYKVKKLLGQGTFGKVVRAYDNVRKKEVAVKIIRSVQKYRDASRIELRVLSTLASNDRQNRNKCIHLRDTFDYRNHICIVTDLLGQSVFDFLKGNTFVPFPSSHIQQFARQLFTSVAFLHDLNLVHTDLKPENILLVSSTYQTFTYNRNIPSSSKTTARSAKFRRVLLSPEIRLIDFGSATFDDEYHSSVVSTRHYRAPEIILNVGWSFPCDIWSIGCILVEFFTGDALFQTHDNLEHLAMMEAVCGGPIDKAIIRSVTGGRGSNKNAAAAYFKRQSLDYPQPDTPRSSRKFVNAMKPLHDIIPDHTQFNRHFLDLLRRIFVYDPSKRITAKEALKHPWFREHFEDDGTEAEKIRMEREKKAALELQQQ